MKKLLHTVCFFLLLTVSINAQNVGVGTTSPSTRLYVLSSDQSTATFEGPDLMYIVLREAGFYRGYIGSYSGAAADVDFGTGSGNTTGKTHLTIQGVPKLTVDAGGNTDIAGELNSSAKTGAANLVPICYGNVSASGFINTGSGNFSVSKITTGWYAIAITGEAYQFQTYIAVITPAGTSDPCFASTGSGGGNLYVYLKNLSGTAVDNQFNFIVYKP